MRELRGVMAHEKVDKAFFMAPQGSLDDARAFAAENRITLLDGKLFLAMLQRLPAESNRRLLELATEGDWTTPTCPSCGTKMVARDSKRGAFWGAPPTRNVAASWRCAPRENRQTDSGMSTARPLRRKRFEVAVAAMSAVLLTTPAAAFAQAIYRCEQDGRVTAPSTPHDRRRDPAGEQTKCKTAVRAPRRP